MLDVSVPPPQTVSSGPFAGHTALSLRERLYAPLKILTLVQALDEFGVCSERALAGTGLSSAQIDDPATRTSVQQLLTVGRNAVRLCPAPELGLRVGQRLHISCYGLYGYAMLCTATMREGFEMSMRYHALGTPVMPVRRSEDGGTAVWHLPTHDELALLALTPEQYRFFLDVQFAGHVTLITDVMGPWCRPVEALYAMPAPAHADDVARTLGCPVTFGHTRNELHYPREWLDRAPQMANPITAAQMSETCERLLSQIAWQAGLTRRVYEELTRIPGRFPGIEDVASSLCMTSRTLRRRLSDEGTSFSELLSSVRHALALDYLGSTSLSLEDIAAALDFSDANSFRHAFKRWTGKSPLEVRR
ncbi:AraC family transcriptional regulator [Roseateles amylovorans]|uniref:AraC family transcriptional regulator n=1 Tax=Roseateles amylovorans TaxID=2978473 RepID=A0ABY6B429_9BURK|nr:AraC family transcriptional regulator [Roseateles amylovorans]UXH79945.1 AraC family transcriptional regulator [Roseateles amylovorans]